MIRLLTTFNGKPAPGGLFDPTTKTYTKACRSQNGGQHPHRYDLGGIDAPIVERLKELSCNKIILELPGATYEIPFKKFLENGYPQKWNDPRFKYPRWYCPIQNWESESLVRYETPTAREEHPTQQQASLFCDQELQSLAQVGRWG